MHQFQVSTRAICVPATSLRPWTQDTPATAWLQRHFARLEWPHGRVVADSGLADVARSVLASIPPRAHIADFTFTPTDGARVKFLVNRYSAGDKLALLLTALSQ